MYQKRCIQKRCITMPRLTSRCPNCNAINIRRVASQNGRETSIFCTFSTALRWIFVALQIGDQEVILRVVPHLFPIHHLLVGFMVKYLIGGDVLMWFWFLPTASVRTVVNTKHRVAPVNLHCRLIAKGSKRHGRVTTHRTLHMFTQFIHTL